MNRFLLVLAALLAATPAFALEFDLCGTLTTTVPCSSESGLYFISESGSYFVLDTFADFDAGDFVHVSGTYPAFCWVPACMTDIECIEVGSIEFCSPVPVAASSWGFVKTLYR